MNNLTQNAAVSTIQRNNKATNSALYIEDEIKIVDPLSANIGARIDNHTGYGQQVNPKLSILYKLNNINLRTSVGKAFRAPTFNDLYYPEDSYARSNPGLKPETSIGYDFGIETWFSKYIARVNIFRNDITDMIMWAPTGPMGSYGPKWQPTNLNLLVSQGLEFEFKATLMESINCQVSYTYIDATQKNKEIVDSYTNEMKETTRVAADTPKHRIVGSLGYETKFGLNVFLSGRYLSKRQRYYIKYAAFPSSAVTMDTKELADYFVSDIKLTQKLFDKLNLYLTIDNILDAKFKEQMGSDVNDKDYPLPGRTFTFGAKYQF